MTTIACLLTECVYQYHSIYRWESAGWWVDCRDVKCAWTGPCEVCVTVDFVFHFGLIRRARVSVCDSCTGGGRPAGAGVRRLQRAGLCRCGSRKLRFAPGEWAWDETWNWQLHTPHMVQFERVSCLGGLLVIWHFLTCKYFDYFLRKMALLQPLLYSLQLWLSTGHVEMVENEKFLHSNSAKIAVPDWSILRSVKEPRFRITPSRADVPLIPEWIVETYFHS